MQLLPLSLARSHSRVQTESEQPGHLSAIQAFEAASVFYCIISRQRWRGYRIHGHTRPRSPVASTLYTTNVTQSLSNTHRQTDRQTAEPRQIQTDANQHVPGDKVSSLWLQRNNMHPPASATATLNSGFQSCPWVGLTHGWNSLPATVTSSPSLLTFKRRLQTELFARS